MTEQRDQTGLTGGALPHTALPVGTPGAAPGGGAGVEESLEPKFLELADQWRTDSLVMSSVTDMARLPSYQQIIALGPPVIPLLLRELERRPGHWFVALHALTGATPIPEESRGRVKEMAQAWLRWGREQGYRW